jgi:flagellar assembly protein FliH
MRSSSSAARRTGVVEGIGFSRWALADLSEEPRVEVAAEAALDPLVEAEAAARAEAEALERAGAEARRREEDREEAERLAAEEQERRVEEAYRRGYEEGRTEGEIAEGARLRSAVAAAEEALDGLRSGEMRWTGTIEENICALAVAVARHVIGRELREDALPVLQLVRDALAEFPIDQPIRIRLSPGDLHCIRQLEDGEDRLASFAQDREARWVSDPQVAPGGCVVEGRERIVDGRVDTALERIYRRLTYTHA